MKRIFVLAASLALLTACNNTESEHVTTSEAQTAGASTGTEYTVDSSSQIIWEGSKPTGTHVGSFPISNGTLFVDNQNLTGGKFSINIEQMTNQDLASDPENQGKLIGHLKSPDFFDTQKFPTAGFEITGVAPFVLDSSNLPLLENPTHLIQGNLTLKDSTKNISFPAKITIDGNSISALANFNIDRTLWGMNYKGPNNPQDWFISKTVGLKINLSATKK